MHEDADYCCCRDRRQTIWENARNNDRKKAAVKTDVPTDAYDHDCRTDSEVERLEQIHVIALHERHPLHANHAEKVDGEATGHEHRYRFYDRCELADKRQSDT